MRLFGALFAIVVLVAGAVNAEERQPRVVFNDDAQMLSETPPTGATDFVSACCSLNRKPVVPLPTITPGALTVFRFGTWESTSATNPLPRRNNKLGWLYGRER